MQMQPLCGRGGGRGRGYEEVFCWGGFLPHPYLFVGGYLWFQVCGGECLTWLSYPTFVIMRLDVCERNGFGLDVGDV